MEQQGPHRAERTGGALWAAWLEEIFTSKMISLEMFARQVGSNSQIANARMSYPYKTSAKLHNIWPI